MKDIVFLFNLTPYAPDPWARRGYDVHCYDKLIEEDHVESVGNGRVFYHPWECDTPSALADLIERHPSPHLIGGFPPCTDLSVAGNRWRKRKFEENQNYLQDAIKRLHLVKDFADVTGARYFIEQPVGLASALFGEPDVRFIPAQFGGYLPEDDVHPRWPDKIPPQDAYSKKTVFWIGNGFQMPEPKPVPVRIKQITCSYWFKDLVEERIYRSATPRGLCKAIAEANS